MTERMKVTSIQLHEDTRVKLESKKLYDRESYESVIKRMLEEEDIPSMEEMFRRADGLKMKKHSAEDVVKLIHQLREK